MSRKNEAPHDGRVPTRGSPTSLSKEKNPKKLYLKKNKKKTSGSAKDFIGYGHLPLCPSPTATATVSPSARRPLGTSACPSSRPWACGGGGRHRHRRRAGGASCERRRWRQRRRGRGVFVSPSPGPSVCCASEACAPCCGSSSGHTAGPAPARRGPHLARRRGRREVAALTTPTRQIAP